MLIQVHDELVFDVEPNEAKKIIDGVKTIMSNAIALSIPLLVEVDIGKNWEQSHSLDDAVKEDINISIQQ